MADSPPNEPNERTLERLKMGDIAALASLFQLFGQRVHRLSCRMLGNAADAEDATQEIFVRVFQQGAKFAGRAQFSTWLYRLTVHHCLNKIKQRERQSAAEAAAARRAQAARPPAQGAPGLHLAARDELALVDQWLAGLPPHYRVCIVLREIEDLSYARIAELLEVPIGTVMSRLARARELLRARLAESHEKQAADGNNPARPVVQADGGTNPP